jgi:hypothetical protein
MRSLCTHSTHSTHIQRPATSFSCAHAKGVYSPDSRLAVSSAVPVAVLVLVAVAVLVLLPVLVCQSVRKSGRRASRSTAQLLSLAAAASLEGPFLRAFLQLQHAMRAR